MKKSICLALSLLILLWALAGCGKTAPEERSPSDVSPAGEATEEPLSFSLGSLPQIGAFAPDEKKDYFFPDGPHDVFEPRDDYGEIIPYCTDIEYYKEVGSYVYEDENGKEYTEEVENRFEDYLYRFGLMTTDGRIITSGIYDFYTVEIDESGNKVFICYIESHEEMFKAIKHVIGGDGSWMKILGDSLNTLPESLMKIGVLHVQDYPDWTQEGDSPPEVDEYYLYDGRKLDFMKTYVQYGKEETQIVYTGDDSCMVTVYHEESEDNEAYTDCICCAYDGTERYRFQAKGSVELLGDDLLKSYAYGENGFSDAVVFDLQGNKLLDGKNEFVYDITHKIILGNDEAEERVSAYNRDFEKLWEADILWDWLMLDEDEVMIFDDKSREVYSLSDGRPIDFGVKDYDNIIPLNQYWQSETSTCLLVTTKGEDAYVFDYDGVQLAKIKKPIINVHDNMDSIWYEPMVRIESGLLFSAAEDHWYFYDLSTDKETVLPTHGIRIGREEGSDDYWNIEHLDENYLVLYHSMDDIYAETELFESQTGRLLDQNLVFVEQVGDYLLLATVSGSYVYRSDGSLLLKLQNNNLV